MTSRKNYVNNKDLLKEIKSCRDCGEISENLHMMFWEMSNRIISRPRFNRYTVDWKEDMISTAYIKCIDIYHKFDLERTNPFSYFTTVISNCFLDYAGYECKQKKIKDKMRTKVFGYDSNSQVNNNNSIDEM